MYDFRNPGVGEEGFLWSQVASSWQGWTVEEFRSALKHGLARHAFERDQRALEWCDCCVLVLPSGMSAHLEAGWCAGRGKPVLVYAPEIREAELMYKLFDSDGVTPLFTTIGDVLSAVAMARSAEALARS
ncbi:MAG TPA: hypothetical protein VFQ61_28975 [Polyangiaceae bacterium]|nr:hypothetical protein [Polyangiaceae bacterium]